MSTQLAAYPLGWRIYAYVLLGVGIFGCWAFVALYTKKYRWWTDPFGQHLVAFSACLGLFLTYYGVLVVWPDMPGRGAVRLALFTLLTVVIVWRLVLFGRFTRAKERERTKGNRT